jgi:hypothetical protein
MSDIRFIPLILNSNNYPSILAGSYDKVSMPIYPTIGPMETNGVTSNYSTPTSTNNDSQTDMEAAGTNLPDPR